MKAVGALLVSAALIVFCASPALAAPRRANGPPSDAAAPALAGLLAQYPVGGRGLTAATETLLDNSPGNAAALVEAARTGNPEQKAAIALGILHALNSLDSASQAAQTINAALAGADPEFRAVLSALQIQLNAQNEARGGSRGGIFGGAGGGGFSGGGGPIIAPFIVSPN